MDFIIRIRLKERVAVLKKYFKYLITLLLLIVAFNANNLTASAVEGPAQGKITSTFGYRIDPFSGKQAVHQGLDIAAPMGTPVYAMQDGFVIFSGVKGGYGNTIVLDHCFSDIPELPRLQTLYGHNSSLLVKYGDYVRRGQPIALIGSTGRSTGPHLHFGVIYKNSYINPMEYLEKLPSYLAYADRVRVSKTGKSNYGVNTSIGGR